MTLLEVFFSPELRAQIAKPHLGLTLERVRNRFRPQRDAPRPCVYTQADCQDLARTVFGAESVAVWYATGPADGGEGLLDLFLRGTALRAPSGGSAVDLGETALEAVPGTETVALPPASGAAPAVAAPADVRLALDDRSRRLGPYVLLAELGRGGMGVVLRAWDPRLEREVAIKILRCAGDHDPGAVERFGREARAVARLRHENIVAVYEVVPHERQPYLVMQYVQGHTLGEWLEAAPRSPAEVARVVAQVARALHYAHEKGLVHRDVKPANVMIDHDGRPVLMDFGLALDLAANTRLTTTGQIMGTPMYMAPEQIDGGPLGAATDVYSLGAVLYQGLCGRAPFDARSPTELFKKVLLDMPPAPRTVSPTVPIDLEEIALRCLAKAAGERYPSAFALAQALERCGAAS